MIVTSSSPVQAGEVAGNMKATQSVEAPSTKRGDVINKNTTQPVEASSAGTATQPVEPPGAGPEVLLTGTSSAAVHLDQSLTSGKTVTSAGVSDSEDELQSDPGSPVDGKVQEVSPDRDIVKDETADQELSKEATYRETIKGVRSFMGWNQIPDFDSSSFSSDDNPFACSRDQPTGKVSVKLPVEEQLCRKLEKLSLTIAERYPSRTSETAGLLRD